jgi:hypothetical protein
MAYEAEMELESRRGTGLPSGSSEPMTRGTWWKFVPIRCFNERLVTSPRQRMGVTGRRQPRTKSVRRILQSDSARSHFGEIS